MTEVGQRHATVVPSLPRLRLAVAALLLGGALAGAAVLHAHKVLHVYDCSSRLGSCMYEVRLETPGWVNPVAIGICLLGLAAAAAVLMRPLRRFMVARRSNHE